MATSPRLRRRFSAIRGLASRLRAELKACRKDANAVAEHLDYSITGNITVGACDAAIEDCTRILKVFE